MAQLPHHALGLGCVAVPAAPGCATRSSHDTPEYYLFRPAVEKAYGYAHAVRVGDHIKFSGAVSMNDQGELVTPGNLELQIKILLR